MTTDDTFANWLRANPAPDLQALVRKYGGYDKIPPEAWAEYDRAMAEWQQRRRSRHVVVQGVDADPESASAGSPVSIGGRARAAGAQSGAVSSIAIVGQTTPSKRRTTRGLHIGKHGAEYARVERDLYLIVAGERYFRAIHKIEEAPVRGQRGARA